MLEAADPHVIAPGMAPTPFTAEQIREGCPAGRTVTVRVLDGDDPGRLETTRFISCDGDGAVMEKTVRDLSGQTLSLPESRFSTWRELQAHAAFPETRTMVTREIVTTELGVFDCVHYEVAREDGAAHFWFALELPGMPIKVRAPLRQMDMVETTG